MKPAWATSWHTVEGSREWGKTDRQISSESLAFSVKLNRPSYLLLEVLADSSRYTLSSQEKYQVLSHYKGQTQLMTKFISFLGVYSQIYSLKVKKNIFLCTNSNLT